MKWFKLTVSCLILVIIGLFIYQNLPTFNEMPSFRLNLYVSKEIEWNHHLYTLLCMAASLGFLAGIAAMLGPYFKTRRLLAQERQERLQSGPMQQEVRAPNESDASAG